MTVSRENQYETARHPRQERKRKGHERTLGIGTQDVRLEKVPLVC
jgi:hypothetical protein